MKVIVPTERSAHRVRSITSESERAKRVWIPLYIWAVNRQMRRRIIKIIDPPLARSLARARIHYQDLPREFGSRQFPARVIFPGMTTYSRENLGGAIVMGAAFFSFNPSMYTLIIDRALSPSSAFTECSSIAAAARILEPVVAGAHYNQHVG